MTWRLVIGADLLPEREKWWRWADLERLAPPLVIGRQGAEAAEEAPGVQLPDVSSTEIRERIARGAPIDDRVPRSVAAYIAERGLYL